MSDYCDYGHDTSEARRLPLDDRTSGAGIYVCHYHYEHEMAERKARGNDERKVWAWEDLPCQKDGA
jgi:hypothetical protein